MLRRSFRPLIVVPIAVLAVSAAVGVTAALMACQYGSSQAKAQPAPLIDFFLEVATAGCNTDAGPAVCNVSVGSEFTVDMHLKSFSGLPDSDADTTPGYTGFRGGLNNSVGLTRIDAPGHTEVVWPDGGCFLLFFTVHFGVACQTGPLTPPPPESTFTGLMMEVAYQCGPGPSVETVTMVHAEPFGTNIQDESTIFIVDTDPDETLTINCREPLTPTNTPAPTDTPTFPAAPGDGADADGAAISLPQTGGGSDGTGITAMLTWLAAGAVAGALALGCAAWYTKRRWTK